MAESGHILTWPPIIHSVLLARWLANHPKPSDSSGRNVVWNSSSVLQYRHFRVPAFDRRGTFVLSASQEDEALFRETFESLSSYPLAEKHVRIVLARKGPREVSPPQD